MFIFSEEKRRQLQEERPELSESELTRLLARMWNDLSEKKKVRPARKAGAGRGAGTRDVRAGPAPRRPRPCAPPPRRRGPALCPRAPPGGGPRSRCRLSVPQAKYKAREAALKAQSERKPGAEREERGKLPESPKRAEEIWQQSVIGDYLARFKVGAAGGPQRPRPAPGAR